MKLRKRFYDSLISEHLRDQRQMALISGPRQVGKTTVCRERCSGYLNWDNIDDRRLIMAGPGAVAQTLELDKLRPQVPVCLFDELHKFSRWKQFLKGFFDTYADQVRILITGSSRMDVYRRGGDSLMGRYFLYRMHPFSVAEAVYQNLPDPTRLYRDPKKVSEADFTALWTHGGYPEPFLKRDMRFTRRWTNLRLQQFLREDVRDMTQIHQFDQLEVLVNVLMNRSSDQLVFSNLAKAIQISNDTVRRWISTLCMLHLGFLIRPWYKNVSRSLRKEPKWFLRDWSGIEDPDQRAETFVACHLLKAVQGWTDMGLGSFELGYLRDKDQREVDFVVIRDGLPWFLVEAKHSETKLSPALKYFQNQLNVPYAFQVVIQADAVDADCFTNAHRPTVVPARTFLSQLL